MMSTLYRPFIVESHSDVHYVLTHQIKVQALLNIQDLKRQTLLLGG